MAVAWPNINLDVLRDSVEWSPEDGAYHFKPDVGPAINLSRSIVANDKTTFQQWFTQAEYDTLTAWYRDDLANGTLAFEREHPFESGTATFTFAAQDGLKLVKLLPDQFLVAFNLERVA